MTFSKISLAVACAFGVASTAQAAPFQRADENAQRSLTQGLGSARPQLLQRSAGRLEATLAALSTQVCAHDCATAAREERVDSVRLSGNGWHLDVFGDGTLAEYSNDAARAAAHAQGVESARAMSASALEQAGRRYIATALADVITLGPGEALVPEAAYARVDGGVDARGRQDAPKTTANRIVFTREIDGIPVVGNGSKVVLTFHNDGSLESFRYDWPTYVIRGGGQTMAARDVLLRRVQTVLGERSGGVVAKAIDVQPTNPTVDLGGGVELNRFECGYYDAGLLDRDASAPVQAGCVYHGVHAATGAVVTRAGYSGAVPAAAKPEADPRWPEEALLRGRQPAQRASDPGTAASL